MGDTYTRRSTYTDGDVITAGHTNDEFNQLVAAFASTSGHSHDGTAGEGGIIANLLSNAITFGTGADADVVLTFNATSTNDGVLKWMEDEDYFEFSDDILMATTEKIQFTNTSNYIHSASAGNLDLVAATEIHLTATTINMDGVADISSNLAVGGNLTVAGNATVTGTTTFNGGTLTLGDSASDNVVFGADVDSNIIPDDDGTYDLGSASQEWRDIYIDGTAHIDTLDVDVNATVAGTLGVTGAITGSSTVQGTTVTATTAFVPGTSDGATLGTTSLEFSDLFLADDSVISLGADQDVTLTHVHNDGIRLNSSKQLQFRDSGLYINSSTDGQLDIVADTEIQIAATTIDINGAVVASGEIAAASLDISGNVDIDGITNLDVVDIDGAVQLDATLTIGANDQGYDVILYGDTASANITWDTSVDDLIFNGAAGLIVPDGQFTLGSTAVTSTAAEINLIDGGTSRGTTAVASGDGILINDAGTMRMTNVDTVSTYFSSHNVGGGNIVTTGALNSGSITSGFGTIDTGSSAITTTGVITGGTLEATTDTAAGDNAAIGYTAAEGLILTGQGSTNDVTIKNDNDVIVMRVPTGTDDVVFADNVTISGDLTISGDTTTVSTSNMVVADNLIELNNGASSNSNDSGIVIERGSTGDNAIFMWDESADTFVLGTTTATGASTGNLSVTDGALQAGSLDISGNIDVDGTANLDVVDIDGAVDMATTLAVAGNVDFNGDLDVDGTTNLDAVDIDGAVDMATTLSVTGNVTLGAQLIMPDVTSTKILVADGTSYQEVAVSGDVTIANTGAVTIAANAVEGSMLNNNTISGQTALTSGLATDDELLVSDGGTLKRMDISVLTTLTDDNATALAIALG